MLARTFCVYNAGLKVDVVREIYFQEYTIKEYNYTTTTSNYKSINYHYYKQLNTV